MQARYARPPRSYLLTPEGNRREAPEDWRRVTVIPQLEVSNLWSMSREMGWVIQCTALRVFEDSVECPS